MSGQEEKLASETGSSVGGRGSDEHSGWGSQLWARWMALLAGAIWLATATWYLRASDEPGAVHAIVLLGLASLYSLTLVGFHGGRNHVLGGVSIVTISLVFIQACGLAVYCSTAAVPVVLLDAFALLSICLGGAVVFGALRLASRMLRSNQIGRGGAARSNGLLHTLRHHSFAAVCFFLAAFCLVASYVSFAFAFHDQGLRRTSGFSEGGGSLEQGALTSPVDDPTVGLYAATIRPPGRVQMDSDLESELSGGLSPLEATWEISFPPGSAAVISSKDYLVYPQQFIADLPEREDRIKAANALALQGLVETILRYHDRERVRVLLVGHADETPVDLDRGVYGSNFEISEARVRQVMVELVRWLEERDPSWRRNIDWLPVPVSSDGGFLDDVRLVQPSAHNPYLTVEAAVIPSGDRREAGVDRLPGRSFELLDYLYFTFYTITTTGYGDIIPLSPFAKFVASIANVFEVVFVVIFFNVLVSFLRNGLSGRTESNEAEPSTKDR